MSRRTTALIVLVVAASLAGCNALSGGETGATPAHGDADAEAIAAAAADEMAAAETYRLSGTVEQTVRANNQEQTATVTSEAAFDRADRAFRIERTTATAGRTVEGATYLLNGTLYERNPAYERAYGSEWVRVNVSERLDRTWRAQDTLTRQRVVLENATVSDEGTATVDGTETDVLAVDGDEAALEGLVERRLGDVGADVEATVENASFTHYVATDSDRLRRVTGTVELSVTAGARTLSRIQEMSLTVSDYGVPVDVALPEGAAVAVDVTNEST